MRNALAPLVLCLMPAGAVAGGISSTYTDYDLDRCAQVEKPKPEEEFGGSLLCKGLGGLKVFFTEGDLRQSVSFGRAPRTHCAARQSFGGFNTALPKIEWRLRDGKPFAVIQRWSVSYDPEDADKQKTWLVVTKLEDNDSCRAAVVEGALPKANQQARDAADHLTPGFDCARDVPKVISTTPVKAEALMWGSPCGQE